jgi:hypothetical protein
MTTCAEMHKAGLSRIEMFYNRQFPVDTCRNVLVKKALATNSDYILFIDADQTFSASMVSMLVKGIQHTGAGIYSGTYFHKAGMHDCVAKMEDKPGYFRAIEEGPDKLVDVDLVGMGCALIDCAIFSKIEPPYFAYSVHPVEFDGIISEDVCFCRKVKAAGYKIINDWNILCGHCVTEAVDIELHRTIRTMFKKMMEEKEANKHE